MKNLIVENSNGSMETMMLNHDFFWTMLGLNKRSIDFVKNPDYE